MRVPLHRPKLNGVAPDNPANFPPRAAKILLEG
jgi:hypothetical protein